MSLFKSIATFGGFTFISRITGFLRDMVLANLLGAGMVSDAFFVSFKLPNLFRSLFAEGAFTSAFVPIFSQKLVSEGKKNSLLFAGQAISVLILFLIIFVALFEIFMPTVVHILAPGFVHDAGKIELAASLCRITFPFLLFISIVSFQAGILNSFEKFAAPAAAPIILNLTMILSGFIFVPFTPTPAHAFAFGITLAGILEILWLQFFLARQSAFIRPYFHPFEVLRNPQIRLLFKRIAPGIVGAGIYQINMVVDTILVSLVGTGAISWLYYANRLQQLPLGVVGAAISVALLPILSKQLKSGDVVESRQSQDKALEYGALLSFPAAVLMFTLSKPMINILFEHGRFSATDTTLTSYALMAYAIGLPCYVLAKALMPNFFARGDTVTPVKYSAVVFGTNLVANLILMQWFGHVGIAAATTLAAFVSVYQYLHGLKKRAYWQMSATLKRKLFKIGLCSLLMGLSVWILSFLLGNWLELNVLFKLIVLGGISVFGLAVFLVCAKLLGVLDVTEILATFLKRKKKSAIALGLGLCLFATVPVAEAKEPLINFEKQGVFLSDFSTAELEEFYKDADYQKYIEPEGNAYPRIFVRNLPFDYAAYANLTERNRLFIKILMPLVLKINNEVLEDRADLEALKYGRADTPDFDATECGILEEFSKKYDVFTPFEDTRRCAKMLDELLQKADIVPPSILIAAAAIYTDWGTSRVAVEGNNLYQARNWYSDEGLVSTEEPNEPYRFKIYPSLEESIREYVLKINSHVNYKQFRDARAVSHKFSEVMYGKRLDWAFVLDNNLQNYAGLLDYTLTFYRLQSLDEAELEPEYDFKD